MNTKQQLLLSFLFILISGFFIKLSFGNIEAFFQQSSPTQEPPVAPPDMPNFGPERVEIPTKKTQIARLDSRDRDAIIVGERLPELDDGKITLATRSRYLIDYCPRFVTVLQENPALPHSRDGRYFYGQVHGPKS